jgi:hypothetical protein
MSSKSVGTTPDSLLTLGKLLSPLEFFRSRTDIHHLDPSRSELTVMEIPPTPEVSPVTSPIARIMKVSVGTEPMESSTMSVATSTVPDNSESPLLMVALTTAAVTAVATAMTLRFFQPST